MAVALDLHFGLEYKSEAFDITIWGCDKRQEMISLLENSNEYWRIAKDTSYEATKAHAIFSYILKKVKTALGMNGLQPGIEPSSMEAMTGLGVMVGNSEWGLSMEDQAMLDFDWVNEHLFIRILEQGEYMADSSM